MPQFPLGWFRCPCGGAVCAEPTEFPGKGFSAECSDKRGPCVEVGVRFGKTKIKALEAFYDALPRRAS